MYDGLPKELSLAVVIAQLKVGQDHGPFAGHTANIPNRCGSATGRNHRGYVNLGELVMRNQHDQVK